MMAVDGGLGGLGGQTFGTVHAGVAALGFTSVVSRGLFAYALGALGALVRGSVCQVKGFYR